MPLLSAAAARRRYSSRADQCRDTAMPELRRTRRARCRPLRVLPGPAGHDRVSGVHGVCSFKAPRSARPVAQRAAGPRRHSRTRPNARRAGGTCTGFASATSTCSSAQAATEPGLRQLRSSGCALSASSRRSSFRRAPTHERPPIVRRRRLIACAYRPCPQCGKMMNRQNFGRLSGAIVDTCHAHGTFLDRGELHQVVRFILDGGFDRMRQAELARLKEEQQRLRELELHLSRSRGGQG